ncbi:MAG TPA: glycoside hydrolase family 2 TIM barrel-domain containing protein [Candidatus Krumholzibacteria bacterium]|nr:glycoside hydrolase family 2 TIM barrel-domain containing protein [Candidatus Krumholzibacteria bacterium]
MFRSVHRFVLIALVLLPVAAFAQSDRVEEVRVVTDETGQRLQVDGRDFMVLGMNWDYFPIGTNYSYSLWTQPEDFIRNALDYEMALMQHMGVNAIRVYNGIPPKWVEYIYDNYGIYTVLNHPMLRYGYTLDGVWIPAPEIDYSDPELRAAVTEEIVDLVEQFRDTRGILMWMLGNENNYQLTWSSTEIEALPEGERQAARARHLYSLYGDVTRAIKEVDTKRPVVMVNGDLQYIDLIAEECGPVDIFGTNVYRGISARDLYEEVEAKLGKPVLYAEFGADAFNAREGREDQIMQARYLIGQWQEIYEQAAGKGRVGNCIGGLTFQWSDGWWKFRQEENLDVHDTNASWPNAGYDDYVPGQNNMNEEWWGVVAKGRPSSSGYFQLYPRAAYYALKEAYELDPYAPDTDLETIREHFGEITPAAAALEARGDTAARTGGASSAVRVSGVRMEFETYFTGGENISTPDQSDERDPFEPFQGFDRLESYYVDFEANPSPKVRGELSVNILGNVPRNPIDNLFYENRGVFDPRVRVIQDNPFSADFPPDTTEAFLPRFDRVQVYRASLNWDDDWFRMFAFYRTGHTHWGYEGDFFGLYPEAFYGENIDIYNGEAPLGVEIEGKKALDGVKFAFGPELWWGANPAFLVKYRKQHGRFLTTAIYHEDVASPAAEAVTSIAIPQRDNRRLTLQTETRLGPFGVTAGAIWSGSTEVGEEFQVAERGPDGRFDFFTDEIDDLDTIGGKLKLTWQKGRWNWYGQTAVQGLVAKGGYNHTLNYTGWGLRDTGAGNVRNVITGFTYQAGDFQFGPNFMWQKPFEGPIPREALLTPERQDPVFVDDALAQLGTGLEARSILNSPFQVRGNRETIGSEIVMTYDPTPATWMWQWDNDVKEDARFAASLRFTHRHQPTTQDATVFVSEGGDLFQFGGAPPAKDLWEAHLRVVSKLTPTSRMVFNVMGGPAQPMGSAFDTAEGSEQLNRTIDRLHFDARYVNSRMSLMGVVKKDDWGPYDFHRDFNLTYPLQLIGDVSVTLGAPRWFADSPQTRFGVRASWRSLDEFSDRYEPAVDLTADEDENGREWEIRTYLHFAM